MLSRKNSLEYIFPKDHFFTIGKYTAINSHMRQDKNIHMKSNIKPNIGIKKKKKNRVGKISAHTHICVK